LDIIEILKEAFFGSFKSILGIALIVIPLMIILELGKEYKIIDFLSDKFKPFTKKFGMSGEATFPWIVGLIFGISYGAGVLVQTSEEGLLNNGDKFLLGSFLILCHAVFEDTLLFVALGANGVVVIVLRTIFALCWTYFVSHKPSIIENNI